MESFFSKGASAREGRDKGYNNRRKEGVKLNKEEPNSRKKEKSKMKNRKLRKKTQEKI
jgi:hypothetical protein